MALLLLCAMGQARLKGRALRLCLLGGESGRSLAVCFRTVTPC